MTRPLTKTEIVKQLRARRKELGMTASECAGRLGQTRQAWSSLEVAGTAENVSWDRLARMAAVVDLEFLGVLRER